MSSITPPNPLEKHEDDNQSIVDDTTPLGNITTTSSSNNNGNDERWLDADDSNHINFSTQSSKTNVPSSSSSSSLRNVIGNATIQLSAYINDNLIMVRYASLFTISSLTIYAFVNTPLFFRYRNILDIPSSYFIKRRSITGRLIVCNTERIHSHHQYQSNPFRQQPFQQHQGIATLRQEKQQQQQLLPDQAVTCYIRHLSPIESVLSKKMLHQYWNWMHRFQFFTLPSSSDNADKDRPEGKVSELIHVQIAGIEYPKLNIPPPPSSSKNNDSNLHNPLRKWNPSSETTSTITMHNTVESLGRDFLYKLSEQQYVVKCQFLGRQVPDFNTTTTGTLSGSMNFTKRPIPNMIETTHQIVEHTTSNRIPIETKVQQQIAIVKLYCYPDANLFTSTTEKMQRTTAKVNPFQFMKNLFQRRIDLGQSMIVNGYATVSESGIFPSSTSTSSSPTRIIDTSPNNQQKVRDVQYMNQLSNMEYKAAQNYEGVWNNVVYRNQRTDIIDEVEFQQHSTIIQKLFRWIRGG